MLSARRQAVRIQKTTLALRSELKQSPNLSRRIGTGGAARARNGGAHAVAAVHHRRKDKMRLTNSLTKETAARKKAPRSREKDLDSRGRAVMLPAPAPVSLNYSKTDRWCEVAPKEVLADPGSGPMSPPRREWNGLNRRAGTRSRFPST